MSKKRSLVLGIGCLALLALVFVGLVVLWAVVQPGVPGRTILALRLDGPVVELKAEDPFAQLAGETSLGLRDLHVAFAEAAADDRVRGLRVRIDGYYGGFAVAHELRSLIEGFRASGKWTAAYLDTVGEFAPGNVSYYLASACDEISLNPAGDVNLIGLSARVPFLGGTFEKLGIRPEFPGRGEYKTDRFMYTEKEFTPEYQEMMEWLLESLLDELVQGIAAGRGLDPAEVRELMDRAPYLGAEALEVGLVDQLEDWWQFSERLAAREEGRAKVLGVTAYRKRIGPQLGGPKIAVVTGQGAILRGKNRKEFNPMLGSGQVMGSDTLAKAWRAVREAGDIKAAIFRIDSGGGSPVASEVIRQEMARTAEEIPVVVSMSNVAASGGYWIACGAQRIVADPTAIVGSIGVYTGHLNSEEFFNDKLGITFGRIDLGANANLYSGLDDWTDDQRGTVARMLDRIYDRFLDLVSSSRGMSVEEVDAIGRGRVFSGAQAEANGLVDVLGGFDVALAEAKQLAGIEPDVEVRLVDYPKVEPWWQAMLAKPDQQETALRAAAETLERMWRTGRLETPGVVWMPPIYIE